MIDAFISHIEMGKVSGYDMEGSKNDLKKFIDSLGAKSGGLVSIWDPNTFTKLNVFPSENLLIVEDNREKEILWHHILDFKEGNPGHYLIFGDFNVVQFASERIDTIFNPALANAFNQFIRDGHLWEIPHGGHLFTRINSRGDKLSKLDRFLITENSASYMCRDRV
ncbi:RNA-directed DNA polymerase, eukaryota, reverse transcriptase zinc-binding domain protein [Tanacetum coccineum]